MTEFHNSKKAIEYFFQFACIIAAVSTTCWCVYIYSQDKDVCLVDFKQYNEEKEYIYPSFSLIFVNPFIDEKLKKYGEGISAKTYSQFLEGQLWDERMLNISYDDVTIDMADYFLGYDIMLANLTLKSYNSFGDDENDGWKPPYVSHRHPKWKAFAVDKPYHKGQRIIRIWTKIKTSIFPNSIRPHKTEYNSSSHDFGGLEFILHYPGQIFRSWNLGIGKWAWPLRTNASSKNFVMAFTRRNMDVLVRRNKRMDPCNEDWLNYDKDVLERQMTLIGCRPPYYNDIDLPICPTHETLKQVAPPTPEDLNGYPPACRAISKLQFDYQDIDEDEGMMNEHSQKHPQFSLSITALDTTFKLIELVRAYDIQSLIGNAGGYIGIFLGYALYQMPGTIMHFVRYLKNKNHREPLGGNSDEEITPDQPFIANFDSMAGSHIIGNSENDILLEIKRIKEEVEDMRMKIDGTKRNNASINSYKLSKEEIQLKPIQAATDTMETGHI